jgi:hypothetical protein
LVRRFPWGENKLYPKELDHQLIECPEKKAGAKFQSIQRHATETVISLVPNAVTLVGLADAGLDLV